MLLLQLYTAIFAISLAWSNKIAVLKMINYGASIREEKEFHKANAVVKIIWVFSFLTMSHSGGLLLATTTAILLLLIQWVVFDIALNLFIGKPWFYIGNTAKTDKILTNWLGKKAAGQMKAYLVGAIILSINFFL